MAKEKKETKKTVVKPQRVQANTQAQAPVLKEELIYFMTLILYYMDMIKIFNY